MKLSCMRVIDVFDPEACDTHIMRVSWQVYFNIVCSRRDVVAAIYQYIGGC